MEQVEYRQEGPLEDSLTQMKHFRVWIKGLSERL